MYYSKLLRTQSPILLKNQDGGQEPIFGMQMGFPSNCLSLSRPTLLLCTAQITIFGCPDDWTHLAYYSTPLSTKVLDFGVMFVYNSITVFGTCLHLLYTCIQCNIPFHFTHLFPSSFSTLTCYTLHIN